MAKQAVKKLKLQIEAGKATPAPPVGPALGQAGINIGEFTKRFNDATAQMRGNIIPVIISVYDDRSFDFVLKTTPASICNFNFFTACFAIIYYYFSKFTFSLPVKNPVPQECFFQTLRPVP